MGRRDHRLAVALALAVAGVVACTRGPALAGSVHRDPRLGWSIGSPPGPQGHWSRQRVDGAVLAWRGAAGEQVSLSVRCGLPLAPPAVLARHLRIGVAPNRLFDSREVDVDGRAGWLQIFDAARAGGLDAVRVKTVTRVDPEAGCVQDFVLVARKDWPRAEAWFDAWWASFRAAPAAIEPAPTGAVGAESTP